MGQAFRRAAGKTRSSTLDASSSSPFPPPPPPPPGFVSPKLDANNNGEGSSGDKRSNGFQQRDPKFDEMLNQMVGRITSKSEMGEAFVVENYNRPLPKLRTTKSDSGRYEDRAAPPGTLKVAQLRHIMLLYQGKADDHNGPMDTKQIAERFRLETPQLEKILQFVSLPVEEAVKKQTER